MSDTGYHNGHKIHQHSNHNSHHHHQQQQSTEPAASQGDYQHYIDQYSGGGDSSAQSGESGSFNYQQYIPSQAIELHRHQHNIRSALFDCIDSEQLSSSLTHTMSELIDGSEYIMDEIGLIISNGAASIRHLLASTIIDSELDERVNDVVVAAKQSIRQHTDQLHNMIDQQPINAHHHTVLQLITYALCGVVVIVASVVIHKRIKQKQYQTI